MALKELTQTQSLANLSNLATRKEKFGTLNSVPFPAVTKNAEQIPLDSTYAQSRMFTTYLDSKTKKLIKCSG